MQHEVGATVGRKSLGSRRFIEAIDDVGYAFQSGECVVILKNKLHYLVTVWGLL